LSITAGVLAVIVAISIASVCKLSYVIVDILSLIKKSVTSSDTEITINVSNKKLFFKLKNFLLFLI